MNNNITERKTFSLLLLILPLPPNETKLSTLKIKGILSEGSKTLVSFPADAENTCSDIVSVSLGGCNIFLWRKFEWHILLNLPTSAEDMSVYLRANGEKEY